TKFRRPAVVRATSAFLQRRNAVAADARRRDRRQEASRRTTGLRAVPVYGFGDLVGPGTGSAGSTGDGPVRIRWFGADPVRRGGQAAGSASRRTRCGRVRLQGGSDPGDSTKTARSSRSTVPVG